MGGGTGGGMGADSRVEVADGEIPEETAGPYPGDGTNGPNVLTDSGVVRSDITSSFGSASGVAEGVPITFKLKVYDLTGDTITAMPGAAVYLWHCDRGGNYSLYSDAAADRELSTRRTRGGRGRQHRVHQHLPGLLFRPLAARTLRDLRVPRQGHQRFEQVAYIAVGLAAGHLRDGVRREWLRGERRQPGCGLVATATASSPTAIRCRWRRSPGLSPTVTSPL